MTERSLADPLGMFQFPKQLFAAQQRFLAPNEVYSSMAAASRNLAQINASYVRELLRVNETLLAACMGRSPLADDELPSEAAHQPDCAAP